MKTVTIAHLYPNELNLYGDAGNVLCLYKRLTARGYRVNVNSINMGDRMSDNFDLLFIGGGQDKEMKIIKYDLLRKADAIKYSVQQGKPVLAICGGYQLLGEYYRTNDGDVMCLTGALPFYTIGSSKRMIGNVVFQSPFGEIVGFENHSGKTCLSNSLTPFGKVICGYGNNGEDRTEGVMYKNTFGTYAHGPVLPKNVAFADHLIALATGNNNLAPLDDNIENLCHNYIVKRFT